MGKAIQAPLEDLEDGRVRYHRFRYHCAAGFLEKEDVVLDCGSGTGYGSEILFSRAKKVIGIEKGKQEVISSRKRFGDKVEFIEADLEKMKLPECDVLVAIEVIEHLNDYSCFIKEAKKEAKRLIIISVPLGETMSEDPSHKHDFLNTIEVQELFNDNNWLEFYEARIGRSLFIVFLRKVRYGL